MPDNEWRQWADASLSAVDRQIKDAQRQAETATTFRADLDQVRGRAVSRHGEVTAVADTTGRLLDLRLTDAALHRDPHALATLVVSTTDEARRQAADRALALAEEAFGPGSALTARLAAELEPDRP
ncbi:MAG: YbaB/EbfC family nucleoid-associated protein [Micrococcales bacterium]|nr:YbaB/EbfC family nucleoid-associated protein [Micrococcales bacterium]